VAGVMNLAEADSVNVAWITVIGTLGGVSITALVGVVTALLGQRSQYRRTEQEHRLQGERDLRIARRDSYVRYIVSAQNVFDRAADLYVKNRASPLDLTEFVLEPPQELAEVLVQNETCRVEVLLLASDQVGVALQDYDHHLKAFWKAVGSGNESDHSETWNSETSAYHRLIAIMQTDVSALSLVR
jgi:hypothetical protein